MSMSRKDGYYWFSPGSLVALNESAEASWSTSSSYDSLVMGGFTDRIKPGSWFLVLEQILLYQNNFLPNQWKWGAVIKQLPACKILYGNHIRYMVPIDYGREIQYDSFKLLRE